MNGKAVIRLSFNGSHRELEIAKYAVAYLPNLTPH